MLRCDCSPSCCWEHTEKDELLNLELSNDPSISRGIGPSDTRTELRWDDYKSQADKGALVVVEECMQVDIVNLEAAQFNRFKSWPCIAPDLLIGVARVVLLLSRLFVTRRADGKGVGECHFQLDLVAFFRGL